MYIILIYANNDIFYSCESELTKATYASYLLEYCNTLISK